MKRLFLAMVALLGVAVPANAQLSPTNAAGVTYGHVHLNVSNIEVHKKLWVDTFGGVFVGANFADVVGFAVLVIVLAIRPQGLFRRTA